MSDAEDEIEVVIEVKVKIKIEIVLQFAFYRAEVMNEDLVTQPLNPLSLTHMLSTEGTYPHAFLPTVCKLVAMARGVGGVSKRLVSLNQSTSFPSYQNL
jgi:hypothetical protein